MRQRKIAIFHPYLKGFEVGGAEKFLVELKNLLDADLFIGSIDLDNWGPQIQENPYIQSLYEKGKVQYFLHEPKVNKFKAFRYFIRIFKRFFASHFSPKLKQLSVYDCVIFTIGTVFFMPKIDPKVKKIMYCFAPPRRFTDQFEMIIKDKNPLVKFALKIQKTLAMNYWEKVVNKMDYKISDSENIQKRLLKFTKIDSDVLYPPIQIEKFSYRPPKDYFLSYARLEDLKRIPLIIEAFARCPEKNLVICSSGKLAGWVTSQIAERNLTNISYLGRVSNQKLLDLLSECIAGIYIPVDEDAGITQIEIMASGKMVIGVKEGGLLETVIDGETGILLPKDPTVEDLVNVIKDFDLKRSILNKEKALNQARKYDLSEFQKKLNSILDLVIGA